MVGYTLPPPHPPRAPIKDAPTMVRARLVRCVRTIVGASFMGALGGWGE